MQKCNFQFRRGKYVKNMIEHGYWAFVMFFHQEKQTEKYLSFVFSSIALNMKKGSLSCQTRINYPLLSRYLLIKQYSLYRIIEIGPTASAPSTCYYFQSKFSYWQSDAGLFSFRKKCCTVSTSFLSVNNAEIFDFLEMTSIRTFTTFIFTADQILLLLL